MSLKVAEAAAIISRPDTTLYNWVKAGYLKTALDKNGTLVILDTEDVLHQLAASHPARRSSSRTNPPAGRQRPQNLPVPGPGKFVPFSAVARHLGVSANVVGTRVGRLGLRESCITVGREVAMPSIHVEAIRNMGRKAKPEPKDGPKAEPQPASGALTALILRISEQQAEIEGTLARIEADIKAIKAVWS